MMPSDPDTPMTAGKGKLRLMLVDEGQRDRLQCASRGGDLSQDVDAITILIDHRLQTSDLTLDATQPLSVILFAVPVAEHDAFLSGMPIVPINIPR